MSLATTLGATSFRSYPGRLAGKQKKPKVKSPLNTTQRDRAYTFSCAHVRKPDVREIQEFAVRMHDLRVYLKVNKNNE